MWVTSVTSSQHIAVQISHQGCFVLIIPRPFHASIHHPHLPPIPFSCVITISVSHSIYHHTLLLSCHKHTRHRCCMAQQQ